MNALTHICYWVYVAVAFESTVMKSILYVAIFVLCLFLLAGVFKKVSVNGKAGQVVDDFFNFLKSGDFVSLTEKYPVFIKFEHNHQLTPQERVEDIRQQQQSAFDDAIANYAFNNIDEVRIEKVINQPLQYEQRTDTTVIGTLIYKNGIIKNFKVILHQNMMYSLKIDDECILNDRCVD